MNVTFNVFYEGGILQVEPEIASILLKVYLERQRQEELLKAGKFGYTAADGKISDWRKAAILGEEVGEVCRALNDGESVEALQAELVQVAAVAVAWAEALEQQKVVQKGET